MFEPNEPKTCCTTASRSVISTVIFEGGGGTVLNQLY